jgi:hypothetical protein
VVRQRPPARLYRSRKPVVSSNGRIKLPAVSSPIGEDKSGTPKYACERRGLHGVQACEDSLPATAAGQWSVSRRHLSEGCHRVRNGRSAVRWQPYQKASSAQAPIPPERYTPRSGCHHCRVEERP